MENVKASKLFNVNKIYYVFRKKILSKILSINMCHKWLGKAFLGFHWKESRRLMDRPLLRQLTPRPSPLNKSGEKNMKIISSLQIDLKLLMRITVLSPLSFYFLKRLILPFPVHYFRSLLCSMPDEMDQIQLCEKGSSDPAKSSKDTEGVWYTWSQACNVQRVFLLKITFTFKDIRTR